jgi:hypothetical protein
LLVTGPPFWAGGFIFGPVRATSLKSLASSAARQRSAGFPFCGSEGGYACRPQATDTLVAADCLALAGGPSAADRIRLAEVVGKGEARGERAAEVVVFRSDSYSQLQIPSICLFICNGQKIVMAFLYPPKRQ